MSVNLTILVPATCNIRVFESALFHINLADIIII